MTAAVAAPPDTGTPLSSRLPYLTPVPPCEPPFDDELDARQLPAEARGDGSMSVGGPGSAARLTVGVPFHAVPTALGGRVLPERTATAGTTRATGRANSIAAVGVPPWSSESDVGVQRTGTGSLPPAARTGPVFARALIEVLSGRRPIAQLRVHCAPDVYAGLAQRPSAGALALPHLLNVRVCEPADGVAEVSAAFRRADRVRAMAFRIEGVDGRWRITALELG
ncbi:Rv3235 family protein [Nakamurella sp. GG22]